MGTLDLSHSNQEALGFEPATAEVEGYSAEKPKAMCATGCGRGIPR